MISMITYRDESDGKLTQEERTIYKFLCTVDMIKIITFQPYLNKSDMTSRDSSNIQFAEH